MKTDVTGRLLYALFATYVFLSAFGTRETAANIAVDINGDGGTLIIVVSGLIALALSCDIAINDILPTKYAWPFGAKNRHWLYVSAAFCYMVTLYSLSKYELVTVAQVILYFGHATFGIVFGFRDLLSKRGIMCVR